MVDFSPRHLSLLCAVLLMALVGCSDSTNTGGDDPVVLPDAGGDAAGACGPNTCADENTECVEEPGGLYRCACIDGFVSSDGDCVPVESCAADPCGEHGSCVDTDDGPTCQCEVGFAGQRCDECDEQAGYRADGQGNCLLSLCDPDPCASEPNRECIVDDGQPVCVCRAGTHEDDGRCVPDTTCSADTCTANGTCSDDSGVVECTCEEGWAGDFCDNCDDANGYHDDGQGGCTQDPCLPNPCTDDNRTRCVIDEDTYICECDAGYHLEGGQCVADQSCQPDSCSDNGNCDDSSGVVACACDPGYVGDACNGCDTANAYHDDGQGGCTQDPCLPNPCTDPNKGVCDEDSSTNSGYTCSCDAGYHDDGVGNCTDDPCLPNPCAAQNQACRQTSSGHECYTPDCDDGNPCTDGQLVNGTCQYTDRPDGESCSTTLCVQGQTCSSGQCDAGTPVVCDDDNPCTADSCDPDAGCEYVADDSLVPDDGLACTIDSCQSGSKVHTPDDGECDDGLWCTGTNTCDPTSADADSDGCVATDVPEPPHRPYSPCAYYGACDEATQSFPLITESAGTSCDDGIACTSGDECDADGLCAGAVTGDCSPDSCSQTTSFGGSFDLPSASVVGTVTLDGASLPQESPSSYDLNVWLRAHDTGKLHGLHRVRYSYQSGSPDYFLDDSPSFDTLVVPGVYDVVYSRGLNSSDNVWTTTDGDTIPNGYRMLQEAVVVGRGINPIDIDIPTAGVQGTVTLDGAALPQESPSSYDLNVWLRAHDTGKLHGLHRVRYSYQSGSPDYFLDDSPSYDTVVPEGTYDLVYVRGLNSSDNVWTTTDGDTIPNSYRVLQSDVSLGSGSNSLDIDIPSADVQGTVTLDGAALPQESPSSYDLNVWLRAHDTGKLHGLHRVRYSYQSGSPDYFLDDSPSYDTVVPAGTYDLVYVRGLNSSDNVWTTSDGDTIPNGYRVLQSGVSLGSGSNSLDIDIPSADVQGTVTLDGAALPQESPSSYDLNVWLRAHDTGKLHGLHRVRYSYQSGSPDYFLDDSPSYDTVVPAGTYDLVYVRGLNSSDNVWTTSDGDTIPNGYRVLQSGVSLGSGSNTLDIDIPAADVQGTVTLDGAALPQESPSPYDLNVWLRAHDTGKLHGLHRVRYSYQSSSPDYYLDDSPSFDTIVPAGTYDVVYSRALNSSDNVWTTSDGDTIPNGFRLLQSDVSLGSGSNTLDIDIPSADVQGTVTVDGAALPQESPSSYDLNFWLQSRDTGTLHGLHRVRYSYQSSSPDYFLDDSPSFDTLVTAGTYDLVFSRALNSSDNVWTTSDNDTIPNGFRMLKMCIAIP